MSRSRTISVLLVLVALRCHAERSSRPANPHVAAAQMLTQRYSASRFNAWHVRAAAAGADCSVLQLRTDIILEDSMIEAMHYGAGTYDAVHGGLQQFMREHAFRGVAYRDVSGRLWLYGNVSQTEAEKLQPCR